MLFRREREPTLETLLSQESQPTSWTQTQGRDDFCGKSVCRALHSGTCHQHLPHLASVEYAVPEGQFYACKDKN